MSMLPTKYVLHDCPDVERLCQATAARFLKRTPFPLSHEDREELVSYLITEVWLASERFDGRGNFGAGAHQLARHRCVDWIRALYGRTPGARESRQAHRDAVHLEDLDGWDSWLSAGGSAVGSLIGPSPEDAAMRCGPALQRVLAGGDRP